VPEILADGQLIPRVAHRARALLALARGERLAEIAHWLGWSRMGLWHLRQRYQEWGMAAVFEAERRGRPSGCSPAGACPPRTRRVHGSRRLRAALGPLGLPQPAARGGGAGRRGRDPRHDLARLLAAASLQPQRHRYWKTATRDERFPTQAAKLLWRYERVEWLYDRGEVVRCLAEKPPMQGLVRRLPTQPMPCGQIARREFEYKREGTVTFLVAFTVDEGTRWGGVWRPMTIRTSWRPSAGWPAATPVPGGCT
jgi:winged helix-turn helix protein